MADGTSVGKISLQVDLEGDMKQQISDMASNLGTALKTSLEKATSGMLSGLEKVIGTAMKNINTSISEGLDKMKTQMDGFIKSIQSMTKKIKVPTKMPIPTNMVPAMNPAIPSVSPRGPPTMATGINGAAIQAEIDRVTSHLDLVNQKIELQKEKLSGLKESYERALNPNMKNKLGTQINNTQLSIMKLAEASDKMGYKLNDLDAKMNGTAQATTNMGAAVKVATDKVKQSAKNINTNMGPVGKTADVVTQKFDKMGRMINSALKRVLIMGTLYKVIRGFMGYMSSALATNQQFSNSLAIVKSNLQVAFIPIFNAILPALNAMMSALATVTTYLAAFFSVLGGSSFKASTASAKALNYQKAAIAGVGAASKKTAKEMQKTLAGFDEITNLNTPSVDDAGGGSGGGAGGGIAPIVKPGLDTSKFEVALKNFLAKIDPYLEPARQALGRLRDAFEPLKENIFAGLKWLLDKVLIPLGKWTLTEVVPRFIDILAGAFKVLNAVIEVLKPLFLWLWDNMLKPLAEWTGGVIITVLDGISTALSKIGDWILDNKGPLETLVIIVGSFAAAWGLVNAAIAIWTGLQTAYAVVTSISTVITTAFGAAVAFLTSPFGIAIIVIGSLIAIGILLWKNWDKISAWLKATWESIKVKAVEVWEKIKISIKTTFESIKTSITTIWNNIKTFLVNLWNGFIGTSKTIFSNVWSGIKGVFASVGSWFTGIFTGAWNGIKSAFSSVTSFFQGIWTTIKNTFVTIGHVIGTGIGNAFKTVVNSIIRFAENTINGFIRAINRAISLINKIPGVNVSTLSTLSIPKLATGGMIDQPTLAMVGEAGKEAVLPIDKDRGAMAQIAEMLSNEMGGSGGDYETTAEVDGDVLFKIVMRRLNKRRRQKGLPIIEY